MYLYEMHAHVAPSSSCAKVEAAQTAAIYAQKGYDGMVITNHLQEGMEGFLADGWHAALDALITTYEGMREAGARKGLSILFGFELRNRETHNDYLVYGLTPEMLRGCECLIDMKLERIHELLGQMGAMIFQAHPMRSHMTVQPARWLDGYEVFNGNPRHDSKNEMARLLAVRAGLPGIAGSDFHQVEDACKAGCLFYEKPKDELALAKALREGRYLRVESPRDPLRP